MKEENIICDKCGEKDKPKFFNYYTPITIYGHTNNIRIDLCSNCHKEFHKWLKQTNGEMTK